MATSRYYVLWGILVWSGFPSPGSSNWFGPSLLNMETFTNGDFASPFFQVIYHNTTRNVFVGGRNAIYELTPNMKVASKTVTGPVLDHVQCPPPGGSCKYERKQTDNDNKVLLISHSKQVLLACGTLFQGECKVYSMNLLQNRQLGQKDDITRFVASRGSTVAFFGPGLYTNELALYSAATYDGRPLNLWPANVASRRFFNATHFTFSHNYDYSVSKVTFNPRFTNNYRVKYLYGFSYEGFSYFVTTQQISPGSENYETRLARVCQEDLSFFSYTEVKIKCQRGPDVFNMATAAVLGPASSILKRRLKVNERVSVLYVTFGQTFDHAERVDRSKGSVLCSFPMSQVVGYFTNATRECFQAQSRTQLLEVIHGSINVPCTKANEVIDDNFCGSGFNSYIEGREAIPGGLRTQVDDHVTALTVILQSNKTVAILGTENGTVIKVVLDRKIKQPHLYRISITNSTEDRAIRPSLALDSREEYLYFLTGSTVVKFPVASCAAYSDCDTCLTREDPLNCQWCGTYCAHYEECENKGALSNNVCPPLIFEVSPLNGPVDGGTVLTITGDNFGSAQSGGSDIRVTAAGVPCSIILWEKKRVQCRTDRGSQNLTGPVVMNVKDLTYSYGNYDIQGTFQSEDNFTYLVPKLSRVSPSRGPYSGGTRLSLYGTNLNIGSSQFVTVAGIECQDLRTYSETAECTTGPFIGTNSKGNVYLTVDNALIVSSIASGAKFHYLPDPQIKWIYPKSTTVSGGINLTVTGTNLNSVSRPEMVVIATSTFTGEKMQLSQPCYLTNINGTEMVCPTPELHVAKLHAPTPQAPIVTHIAFQMDGVQSLKELYFRDKELSKLLYYPDPEYFTFKGPRRSREFPLQSQVLELKGKNLNLAHTPKDVKIIIEEKHLCNVTKMTIDTVVCNFPSGVFTAGENHSLASVEVKVGKLQFYPGFLNLVDRPTGISNSLITAAIVIPIFCIIVAIIVVLVYLWRRRVLRRKKSPSYMVSYSADYGNATCGAGPRRRQETNDYHDLRSRNQEHVEPLSVSPLPTAEQCQVDEETMHLLHAENILMHREYLSLGEVIGRGHFGCVYKGELQLPGKDESIAVAVKTLHTYGAVGQEDVKAFLQEGLMMKDFHHHNVLTLIAVCFEANGSPMVVIPYMQHGDLLSYIRDENNSPTVKDLLQFGVQISSGMKYLSDLKFVHRDLAARNCMLDMDHTVKVADFGLSRDIYERDYYSSDNKKTKLPVKWMSPESLEKGTYNTKTDVWSYGVLLWELLTRGVTPYPDVDNWDILQYLKQGRRMPQPSYCPDLLYQIMLRCWREDPRKRPTFAELEEEVMAVITKLELKSRQRRVGLNITYVNYPHSSEQSGDG